MKNNPTNHGYCIFIIVMLLILVFISISGWYHHATKVPSCESIILRPLYDDERVYSFYNNMDDWGCLYLNMSDGFYMVMTGYGK